MKSVVVLSDIHVGHRFAVSPFRWIMPDGSIYSANRAQRALLNAWEEVATDWGTPDILLINGEPIDGQQPKDKGVEVWTTNYLEQIKAAVELIGMFNPKKSYVTRGSNYHVSLGGVSIEEIFGEQLGATKVDGNYVSPELFLDVDGVTFNFAHHIPGSVSGWVYRSTPAAKEMLLLHLNASHKWPFDVLVRSHNHYFWAVQSTSKMAVLTPCWQLQTWFNYRKSSGGTVPDIGAVRFLIDDGDYKLEKKIYRMREWRPPRVKI